jgi:hypothetical protein
MPGWYRAAFEIWIIFDPLRLTVSLGLVWPNGSARLLLLAPSVTLVFAIVEVLGGVVSGSLSLLSDSGRMFTKVPSPRRTKGRQ